MTYSDRPILVCSSRMLVVKCLAVCVATAYYCGIASAAVDPNINIPPPPRQIADTTEPLVGTLFFSREQREKIDRARLRGEPIDEESILTPDRKSVINGFVKRSDGKATVWVDGEALSKVTLVIADMVQPSDVGGGNNASRVRLDSAGAEPPKRVYIPKKNRTNPSRKTKSRPVGKVKNK